MLLVHVGSLSLILDKELKEGEFEEDDMKNGETFVEW